MTLSQVIEQHLGLLLIIFNFQVASDLTIVPPLQYFLSSHLQSTSILLSLALSDSILLPFFYIENGINIYRRPKYTGKHNSESGLLKRIKIPGIVDTLSKCFNRHKCSGEAVS